MTAWHIAWNDLSQRKVRSLCVMLGLAVSIALIVSVFTLLQTLNSEMSAQLTDYGPNLLIEGDAGEIKFSYGGITLQGVLVGTEKLTMESAAALEAIEDQAMIQAVVPKLFGTVTTFGQEVIISGSDIPQEFAIKPWLRLRDYLAEFNRVQTPGSEPVAMGGEKLELGRQDPATLQLERFDVILGAAVAYELSLFPTNRFMVNDQEFVVKSVLEKNGTAEDQYIMMDLKDAQDILGSPNSVSQIELAIDHSRGSEGDLIKQIRTVIPEARITSQSKALVDREEVMTGLNFFGTAVSVFVLLAAALATSIAMTSSVAERTNEIGLFRAVGLRKSFIRGVILVEGTILSLTGGLLGYVVGNLAAQGFMPVLTDTTNSVFWRLDFLGAALLLAALLGALASIYPAQRAANLDPAEALASTS